MDKGFLFLRYDVSRQCSIVGRNMNEVSSTGVYIDWLMLEEVTS